MKRILAAAMIAGLGAPSVVAHATTPPRAHATVSKPRARPESDARNLLKLEDQWAKAMVKRDGATFDWLLADGFVYTEDDRMMNRADVLQTLTTGTDTVETALNKGMRVHGFGPTAAVTGWLIVRGRASSARFDRRYRFTDTWANLRGRWQIVAAHDYLVPKHRP